MQLTWRECIGAAGLSGFIALIIFYMFDGFYSDLFNQYGDAGSRYFYALGGFVISLVLAMVVATLYASTGTRTNAAWAATKVFLYSFAGWWIAAVIYDAFVLRSQFVNYQWWDYILSFEVVLAYFGREAFGSTTMFWMWTQIAFSILFAIELRHQGAGKTKNYTKNRVKKTGW